LVDLVVKNTNRAPEGRIATIAVDRLLIGFICLGVFRHGHVATTEEIPALSVIVISIDRLLQKLDGLLLALEGVTLLVVEPSKLLKNFGVVWISLKDALVGGLGRLELRVA
jgi:hypothetical protein